MTHLPSGFLDFVASHPELSGLVEALETSPEVSVRVNRSKWRDASVPDSTPVPWCADGFYLPSRPSFTFDPKLHQGLYYVQDASSMAIFSVIQQLAPSSPVRYLDACAAPGGKTTAALGALPAGSLVVANEFDYKRAEILAENVAKWGNPNVIVSRGDTKRLGRLTGCFDIVAVDAPCSGEGMMRKDSQAVEQWSPALISRCAATQREILANVWSSLRPGGYLIYSTCTFNTVENEDNLRWLLTNYDCTPVVIDALADAAGVIGGLGADLPCYRFVPGLVRGEGLFLAVVRKAGDAPVAPVRAKLPKPSTELGAAYSWVLPDTVMMRIKDEVYGVPAYNYGFIDHVRSRLDVIMAGTHVATIKGRDVVPTHALALSSLLSREFFEVCELGYDDAIRYLQREALVLPEGVAHGYVLLTFEGRPLGMVKNLGNRSNSLLPKDWRILSRRP